MHIIVALFSVFAVWRWGDLKNWHKYHATILFMSCGELFYLFLYSGHYIWYFKPDFLIGITVIRILYVFVVFPCSVLLLLSDFPDERIKKILRVLKFILIYAVLEVIYWLTGRMGYRFDWNLCYSILWDIGMFPILVLHYKKPEKAYFLSILWAIIVITLFPPQV